MKYTLKQIQKLIPTFENVFALDGEIQLAKAEGNKDFNYKDSVFYHEKMDLSERVLFDILYEEYIKD